jgi:integrator complex subunit 11
VIKLRETITINDINVTAYYAGHLLGAIMVLLEYKGVKVLYTGDYNSNADRHLGSA